MQVIYIDTLICVNLIIDYILLIIIRKFLHINCKNSRIIFGALLGGVSTTAIFLPFYNDIFSLIYTPAVAVLIILLSFGFKSIRKLIIRTLAYMGSSMLICGIVITLELWWNPSKVMIYNNVLYFDISPALLIITTIGVYFAMCIYKRIRDKHKHNCKIRTVTIEIKDRSKLTFEAIVDTGCNLKEPFSGLDVIIAESELLKGIDISDESKRIIPFSTASGDGMITGFKPSKVFIDGKEVYKGCYIGVCNKKIHGEIKSLMSAELSEVIA